jgi:hypothetical protein
MATSGHIESATRAAAQAGAVDLLIGVPAPVNADELRARAAEALSGLLNSTALRVAVASPASGGGEVASLSADTNSSLRFVSYPLPSAATCALPWLASPAAYRELARLGLGMRARACVILAQDLGALDRAAVEALAHPVLDGGALLNAPLYPGGKYEGLLNSGILYPFIRSLYGRQIRHPVAFDFGIGGSLISQLAGDSRRDPCAAVLFPVIDGAVAAGPMAQSHVDVLHRRHDEVDLSTVMATLAGAMFEDAERNAATWQRVRAWQPAPVFGTPTPALDDAEAVDARPLIESFRLGWRNLREVWGMVLPPVTLLELKRLSLLPAEQFHLPDALWARIVYDFALAHRMRPISRTHLLGALTPLYLAWVASYVAEVQAKDATAAERRIERLAEAYEEAKPYFVSRWRWPDRFNP